MFINEEEKCAASNKTEEERLNSFQAYSTKGRKDLERETDNKAVEGVGKNEGRFNGAYCASREVVLQSLLSRAGMRNLGTGSHRYEWIRISDCDRIHDKTRAELSLPKHLLSFSMPFSFLSFRSLLFSPLLFASHLNSLN